MRTEVKIGIVVGLIFITSGIIFLVSKGRKGDGKVADSVPMDAPASRVVGGTPAGGKAETPAKKPADARQTAPPKTTGVPAPTTPAGGAAPKTASSTTGKPGETPPVAAKPPSPAPPKSATGEPVNPLSGGVTTPPVTALPTTPTSRSVPPATTPALPPIAPGESTRTAGTSGANEAPSPGAGPLVEAPSPAALPKSSLVLPPTSRKEPEHAPAPPPSASPTAGPAGRTGSAGPSKHTVKKSETLWAIAEEYYGDGNLWTKIKVANPGLSENLKVGQVINVPSKEEATGAAAPTKPGEKSKSAASEAKPDTAAKPADTKPEAQPRTYKVQENDTLYAIAKKVLGNGGLWQKIYELNKDKLAKPEDLEVGMELRLPAKEGETAKPEAGKSEKKAEPAKPESGKSEPKKSEPSKTDTGKKTDAGKSSPKKSEADKSNANKPR